MGQVHRDAKELDTHFLQLEQQQQQDMQMLVTASQLLQIPLASVLTQGPMKNPVDAEVTHPVLALDGMCCLK